MIAPFSFGQDEEKNGERKASPHPAVRRGIYCPEVMGMVLFHDGLLAFFSAVGVTTVVWLLAGAVLRAGRPAIPGLLLVLPLRGEALAMEADVRELRRLRRRLPGSRILLADCGMSAAARGLAAYLADREEGMALTEGPEIKLG